MKNYKEAAELVVTMCSDKEQFIALLKNGMKEELFIRDKDQFGNVDSRLPDPLPMQVFNFTRTWFLHDSTVPSRKILEEEFQQFFATNEILEETDVQPRYVASYLKDNKIKDGFQEMVEDAAKHIYDEDANQQKVMAEIHRQMDHLYISVSGSKHILEMEEALPEVVDEILKRSLDPNSYQENLVRFPYRPLDDQFGGLRPREIAVFFGYTGDMKSWTLESATLANALDKIPKRVAHFTFENGYEQTMTRMLAMLAQRDMENGVIKRGIPVQRLTDGSAFPIERDWLRGAIEAFKNLPILLDESPGVDERSVEAIFTKARMFKADLVVIDQASWVENPSGQNYKELWANMYSSTRKIQEHTNEMNVATILAAQANRGSQSSKSGTGLEHIAGSDELTKTSSFVTSLSFDRATASLVCKVLKARRGKDRWGFTMDVDLDTQTKITVGQTGLQI